MNAGSGITKWAPFEVNNTYREVRNPEGVAYIATALGAVDPVKITHLRFRVNLGSTDASLDLSNSLKRLFKALRTYPHLTHLDMAHCQLTDFTCRNHLMPMLECNSSIQSLFLSNNAFTDEGTKDLFAALTLNADSKVSSLDISRNDFSYESMETAGNCILTDRFTSIDFSFSRLGAEGIKLLKPSLMQVKQLKSLLFESVQLGDEGCLEISEILREKGMKSVEIVNLAQNNIGRVGIDKLCANFYPEKNTKVNSLDISRNYFGDEGFGYITDMMWRNSSLKTLKVNKCGITITKFNSFCEKLTTRYKQTYGPYPELETLEVGYNGFGNDFTALFNMLKHPNCIIQSLGYESNEVTNFGAKLWKEFLSKKANYDRVASTELDLLETAAPESQREAFRDMMNKNKARRKNFVKLSLKSNAIETDGAEHLAAMIKSNEFLNELDLRKNNIGVKGAIFFKKAFRGRMAKLSSYGKCFKFHILPEDITSEGVNHLAIGIREGPELLKRFIKTERNKEIHNYVRCDVLQSSWDSALSDPEFENIRQRAAQQIIESNTENTVANNESRPQPLSVKLSKLNLERVNQNRRHKKKDNNEGGQERFHDGLLPTRFSEFDTPEVKDTNRNILTEYKRGIILYGENDEKEDVWAFITLCTYKSLGLCEDARGLVMWHPYLWILLKETGWGSALVGNTLYRYGLLLRLQYLADDENYIKDLYLQRFGGLNNQKLMKEIASQTIEDTISKLVSYDIQKLWETLIPQTRKGSEGLTMFEYVLKYSASPVIDCVRQFINIFPSTKYEAPFLQQEIASSGESYRSLCLKSQDKFVKRYGEAKKLILFRFLEVEPVYNSRFIKISKVEDLLLTEEYNDDERFFYMRRIAASSAQSDEHLADHEFDAHLSLMSTDGKYLSNSNSTEEVKNWILKNENVQLDVEFMPMISQLFNRKQYLSLDRLMPTFTVCYQRTLRDILDTECLGGGRDLERAQISLRMIANALFHINDRSWASSSDWKKDDNSIYPDQRHLKLITTNRIHGNVKPRNIVQRCDFELPDLDKGNDFFPEKWVLSDFTRSTVHGEEYFPAVNSGYNPPEVAKRQMTTDSYYKQKELASEKIDVWQFGCVLFEILSGTTLFKLEARDDTILFEEERAELVNWVSLDEERSMLILNQLSNYASSTYEESEIKLIIESGKQLCERCLQGRPEDRPTLHEILNHPFLVKINTGKIKYEKELDQILTAVTDKTQGNSLGKFFKTKVYPVPSIETAWDNLKFLQAQPHLHLINTDFEQVGVIIKGLEGSLAKHGCRLTTDSLDFHQNVGSKKSYEEMLRKNVQSARVVACFLTKDAFYKPNVVKQLLFAEDFRKKDEKVYGRVLFIDLGSGLELSKDNLTWDKEEFRKNWTLSDEFQYLVKALALQNPSLSKFSLHNESYDDQFDAWNKFVNNEVRGMILSYIQDPVKYYSQSFLAEPLLDKLLLEGHLVPTRNISKYDISKLTKANFKDPTDVLNLKLKERKGKFLNLYFLPAHKERSGAARVYVLCAKSYTDEIFQAVSQIAQALEAPNLSSKVDVKNLRKDKLDPRNKVINRVKTSYNIKKPSHLKTGGRENKLRSLKDSLLNISRSEGKLVLVFLCTAGVFARYKEFLAEVVEKRELNEIVLVLIAGPNWKPTSPEAKKEIEANVPKEFKEDLLNKDKYFPYFKPKKDPWQFDAVSSALVNTAVFKMDRPAVIENFSELAETKTEDLREYTLIQ